MGLATYTRKRNFHQTPEPAADGKRARGIFVVQLHHARRRHYDFRLEFGGTLKSWAVPKGPSFDPAVKRMAVEVEDHPVSYATFEGDIPAGNYGAGHVDVFDHGTWEPEGSVRSGLAKGELKFSLHGDILRGSWVLVRTRRTGNKPQWLLIKHRDDYAGPREADDFVDPDSDRPLPLRERKAVWRDPAATAPRQRESKKSAGAGTRAPLPAGAFSPQLCRVQEHAPAGEAWLHEAKWDGYRLVATVQRGRVRLWSRNGIEWTSKVPGIAAAVRALGLASAQLDGELIALRGGHDDFNALQTALSEGATDDLVLMLFDLPYLDGRSLRELPLIERKARLQALLQQQPQPQLRYSAHHVGDGPAVFAQAVRARKEGIISKRGDSPYRGERNGDWIKVKSRPSDEFVVVGYTLPRGSHIGLGALLLARMGDDGLEYAGRVGSGFADALLRPLRKQLDALRRDAPAVDTALIDTRDRDRARWVRPELVVEVHHQGNGRQGLIRQGAFKGLREDKSPEDLRSVAAHDATQHRLPRKHKPTPAAPVALTHAQRTVFPGDGITKQDVANYYRAVAPLLLAEIAGRPLSVLRCPDGIASACFFQKHAGKGWGDHVRRIAVREKHGSKDYVGVDDATGLLQLVQMNVLEFHPWGAQADAQDYADRLVFDLDPDESVPWRKVKAAARTVRDVLDGVGLRAFLRTSGGKGLHLVVPLAPPVPWAPAKRFAQDLADTLAADQPDTFVSVAGRGRRKGRIFIDWLRNSRGATAVASYSLRARPGAAVAMPLAWSELARLRSGDAFTLRNALQKIRRRKQDPWRELYGLRQALPGTASGTR
jgi:bifunctional non-homologous end joining protein LigD